MFSWRRRSKTEVKNEEKVKRERSVPRVKRERSVPRVKRERSVPRVKEAPRVKNASSKTEPTGSKDQYALVLYEPKKKVIPERRTSASGTTKVKKTRKKGRPSAKRKAASRAVMAREIPLSPTLQGIIGEQEMALPELISRVWRLMKCRGLQNPENGREMILDDQFSSLFGYQKCSMLDLRSLLRPHMIFPKDANSEVDTGSNANSQESELKQEVKTAKEEVKKERAKVKIKQEHGFLKQITVDASSDEDIQSICSSTGNAAELTISGDESTSDEVPQLRWNVHIESMSKAGFKFFISDEELEETPLDKEPLSGLLVDATDSSIHHEGKVSRVSDGYEVLFEKLRANRRYDLFIGEHSQFQIPTRAIKDLTIASAAEFCAFFDPPLGNEVRQKFLDGDALLTWTMEDLSNLGVDDELAARILQVIRDCS